MVKWFQIQSEYSDTSGLTVVLKGNTVQLKVDDVCYLLIGVDGHATSPPDNPPLHVGFMLYSIHYLVTNDEWFLFVDEIQDAVQRGGWTSLSCSKT